MSDLETTALRTPAGPRRIVVFLVAAVVLVAVGVAATLWGIPKWQQHNRRVRVTATATELKAFTEAFEAFAENHGDWPSAAAPGTIPAGMETRLRDTGWTAITPISGNFAWLIDADGVHAGISIVATDTTRPLDRDDINELLRMLRADGMPASRLRHNQRNEPLVVLED
jgi:hypothetical protein